MEEKQLHTSRKTTTRCIHANFLYSFCERLVSVSSPDLNILHLALQGHIGSQSADPLLIASCVGGGGDRTFRFDAFRCWVWSNKVWSRWSGCDCRVVWMMLMFWLVCCWFTAAKLREAWWSGCSVDSSSMLLLETGSWWVVTSCAVVSGANCEFVTGEWVMGEWLEMSAHEGDWSLDTEDPHCCWMSYWWVIKDECMRSRGDKEDGGGIISIAFCLKSSWLNQRISVQIQQERNLQDFSFLQLFLLIFNVKNWSKLEKKLLIGWWKLANQKLS